MASQSTPRICLAVGQLFLPLFIGGRSLHVLRPVKVKRWMYGESPVGPWNSLSILPYIPHGYTQAYAFTARDAQRNASHRRSDCRVQPEANGEMTIRSCSVRGRTDVSSLMQTINRSIQSVALVDTISLPLLCHWLIPDYELLMRQTYRRTQRPTTPRKRNPQGACHLCGVFD